MKIIFNICLLFVYKCMCKQVIEGNCPYKPGELQSKMKDNLDI